MESRQFDRLKEDLSSHHKSAFTAPPGWYMLNAIVGEDEDGDWDMDDVEVHRVPVIAFEQTGYWYPLVPNPYEFSLFSAWEDRDCANTAWLGPFHPEQYPHTPTHEEDVADSARQAVERHLGRRERNARKASP